MNNSNQETYEVGNVNMASKAVFKSLGEFDSGLTRDGHDWIEAADILGKVAGLSGHELVRIVILNLRGDARTWVIDLIKERGIVSWGIFKVEFLKRFSDGKESDEALNKFLRTTEVNDYDSLMNMLKQARKIKVSGSMSTGKLMRQIFARTPSGLKSIMLQHTSNSSSWEKFLRITEDGAWVVFPEKILGRVEDDEMQVNRIGFNSRSADRKIERKEWFCHLHGKGNHSSKYCETIKALESKGWVRKGFQRENSQVKDVFNKNKLLFF